MWTTLRNDTWLIKSEHKLKASKQKIILTEKVQERKLLSVVDNFIQTALQNSVLVEPAL